MITTVATAVATAVAMEFVAIVDGPLVVLEEVVTIVEYS